MDNEKKEQCSNRGGKKKTLLEFLPHVYDFALHIESDLGRGIRTKQSISSAWASKGFHPVLSRQVLENKTEDFRSEMSGSSSKFSASSPK